jgi:hypothetical protein
MSIAGDYVPDSPLDWLFGMLQMVVWADDPVKQVAANLLLFIVALLSSSVTLGATLILAAIFATFGVIGLVRLIWMVVR